MSRKLTIKDIEDKIINDNKKIKLISKEYKRASSLLNFECLVCEHSFKRSWNSISKDDSHCPSCGKNGERLSKQDIKNIVESVGYSIIRFLGGDSYKGTMFTVRCVDGHEYATHYREFKRNEFIVDGGSCKTCSNLGNSTYQRNRRNALNDSVVELGYTIKNDERISTTHDKRVFLCPSGHERATSLGELRISARCATCEDRILKHTEDSIELQLKNAGITYLGNWNASTREVDYICTCGKSTRGDFYSVLYGRKCEDCLNYRKRDMASVQSYFTKYNCTLLEEEYLHSKDILRFICNCGREDWKNFNEFYYRPYCKECGVMKKPRGEKHSSWNPNKTEEERITERKYPEYTEWRNAVFERDSYTCQCCGDNSGGNLVAHHILNYSEHKDLRVELDNGITLCNINCHKQFHDTNGYTNNSKEQLDKFIIAYKKEQIQRTQGGNTNDKR